MKTEVRLAALRAAPQQDVRIEIDMLFSLAGGLVPSTVISFTTDDAAGLRALGRACFARAELLDPATDLHQ